MANGRKKKRRKYSTSSKRFVRESRTEILLELERLIDRLIDECGWQWGDLIYWLWGHLNIHRPDAQEEYEDGTNPEFKYAPREE